MKNRKYGDLIMGKEVDNLSAAPAEWVVLEQRKDGTVLAVRGAYNPATGECRSAIQGFSAWLASRAGSFYLSIVREVSK